MADFHGHTQRGSSLSTLVLVSVIILGLLYFLAKGCTSHSEHEAAPAAPHHGAVENRMPQELQS